MQRLVRILASFGFACVLLFFLFVLTLLGTLEQVDHGLYDVQKKYFESFFLVHHLGPVPLPLPGATLVLALLAVNLLLGGLVRIRKSWATAGVIVVHVGMALLLASALVKWKVAEDGHMQLWEPGAATPLKPYRSDEFESYYLWEVAVFDASQLSDVREYVIPQDWFEHATDGRTVDFTSDELPFTLTLGRYVRNCQPLPKGPMWETPHPTVDGYALRELPLEKEAEANFAGLYATVTPLDGGNPGAPAQGILWGVERFPWTFEAGGRTWAATLRHKRYKMPFTIVMEDFTRELHPGTMTPSAFYSDVRQVSGSDQRQLRISMNQPLRDEGLILFQSGFGPQGAGPGEELYSDFSVVRNPSDKWPEYSCYIIGVGLVLAFGRKLTRFTRSQAARRAGPATGGSPS